MKKRKKLFIFLGIVAVLGAIAYANFNFKRATGTVVQVVQAGYLIGERILRPALVAVSKGGPKAAPAAAEAPPANDNPTMN